DSRLGNYLSGMRPVLQTALPFHHTFFALAVSQCSRETKEAISKFYNTTIRFSFQCNPYSQSAILSSRKAMLSDAQTFVGKTFRLAISNNENQLMTLTEATDHYFVFQSYLNTAPKPEFLYFNKQEFKERFLDSGISLVAKLKHNLRLGVQNG